MCHEVLRDPDTTIQWCQRNFLLAYQRDCSKCDTDCNLVTRDGIDGYAWRRRRKGCQAVSSIRKGSFFEGSHLTLEQILQIVYWWSCDLPLKQVSHETTVSEHTIVDWNHFIREVCVVHFLNNPIMIGGPGSFETVIIIFST